MVQYGESIQKFGGERSWWIRRWDDPFFQKIYKILRDEARKRVKELFHMGSFKSYHGFIKMNVVILCVHGKIQIQFDKRNRDTNEGEHNDSQFMSHKQLFQVLTSGLEHTAKKNCKNTKSTVAEIFYFFM